jgi:UDP-N-acetyl-D-glucosamine dehydrogenase
MLEQKIKNRTARVAVLGLGHVGYPLASLFAMNGFLSIGYDISKKRLDYINQGKAQPEIASLLPTDNVEKSKKLAQISENMLVSNNGEVLKKVDVFIVAVPTPLRENETPNLIFLENTCKTISKFIRKGTLVIVESTIYPGATEEIVKPILEMSGLLAGRDFYLCFSPERIDPGSKRWSLERIPKIVGGIDSDSRRLACLLYSQVVEKVVPVSSLKVAEATKMLENLFRSVNIALINELSKVFEKLGIDLWETIEAASTKPFAFLPHYPGPGVGGHCIPKDPFYLLYKARRMGLTINFVEEASEINRNMPFYVIYIAEETLKRKNKTIGNSSFAVLGITYKKDVADIRRTPAKTVITELTKISKDVTVFDPFTSETFGAKSGSLEQTIANKDCVILLVDHSYFMENGIEQKINELSSDCCLIDTRNFFNQKKLKKSILYRCLGKPPGC